MNERKLGNRRQMVSYYQVRTDSNERLLFASVGRAEILFNIERAMDILYFKYRGSNISFLSKNGLNNSKSERLAERFEGGFLYTCGLDNLDNCVEGKMTHGSLHLTAAENIKVTELDFGLVISADVFNTELFGKNLCLHREFTLTEGSLVISDTLKNLGYTDAEYALLYHINFGYPFLDECTWLNFDSLECEARDAVAEARLGEASKITAPVDGGVEDVFFRTMREGRVELYNPNEEIGITLSYSTEDFPYTMQWKSMISGDYALGIEPATARFDRFSMNRLAAREEKTFKIKVDFK